MYLPDSNILIKAFYGFRLEEEFLKEILSKGEVVISVVVIAEYLVKADQKEKEVLNELISGTKILPVDEETARMAAEYRKKSLKKKRVELLDCFIAAQAKLNKLTLVTNNKSDFPMKDIQIISP